MEKAALIKIGETPDKDIKLAHTALSLSAAHQAGVNLDRYYHHLDEVAQYTAKRFQALLDAGADDSVETRLAALKHAICDEFKYDGDEDSYDDLQNADLVRVIDRRKGLPIALSVIAIHAAQAQGWPIEGLNFPGHFLLRLQKESHLVITDPFHQFQILGAPELRALLKKMAGPEAELSATYYEGASSRDVLIRLQNNIKHRLIEQEDYEGALKIVEELRLIAPKEYRLLFDSSVLHARTGHIRAAIDLMEEYLKNPVPARDRHDAQLFLISLRDSLQ